MGDILSSKKQSTTNTTNNQQVALQGRGQLALSGSMVTGNVSVENSDPEVVLAALQAVGTQSNNNAIVSLAAVDLSRDVTNRALGVADSGLVVANAAVNASHQSVIHTLDAMNGFQNRQLETVDRAVMAAQQTALNAAPVSPGAYAEAIGGQQAVNTKFLIYAAIGIAALIIATRKN